MVKVLLIAPTCDGQDVGEAWVAYQWVRHLADRHELTVLTYHKRGRTPASDQLPGVRVIEWREPSVLGRAERLNSMLKPGYLPFYLRTKHWISAALARGERFDVAHQPTPVAMRYPSPLASGSIPYLIGPVGGSLDSPPGFMDDNSSPWYVGLRRIDRARFKYDPALRRTYRNASCVIGIAPYAARLLNAVPVQRFEVLAETGIDAIPPSVDRSDRSGTVRLLFVGRLVRTKGAREAIRAMALLRDQPVELDIVGDGYDRTSCADLISAMSLNNRVTLHGRIPREQVDAFYRRADIFVFPSFREAGGNAVAEAMSYGLPMVVSDRGGPAASVDNSCGFRLMPSTPMQYSSDIADAIRTLVTDRTLRLAMGAAARARVAAIQTWPRMSDRMTELYCEVARRDPVRPD